MIGLPSGRVLLFGLDGGTWDLLEKLMADATMPNLRALRESSRWAPMRSTIPPVTAPAWASMATGLSPGNTGIFDFEYPSSSIDKFRPITSRNLKDYTFPEILENAGKRVVLVNFPTLSFPPRISGPVLGDVLSPPEHLVSPEALRLEHPFKEYRAFPDTSLLSQPEKYLEDIRSLEAVRFECAKKLFDRDWDLFFVMFSATDWIQHMLFSDLLRGSIASSAAKPIYADLDRYLGWFASRIGEGDSLVLVSDHGFRTYSGTVSINRWLAGNGYLTEKFGARQLSLAVGSRRFYVPARLLNVISRSEKLWSLSAKLVSSVAKQAVNFEGKVDPDPTRTAAYSRDYTWGIFLNTRSRFKDGILSDEEAEALGKKMMAELRGLVDSHLIGDAKTGREVYAGKASGDAPDIVLFPSEYAFSGISQGLVSRFEHNGHSLDGIYMQHGPSIQAGRTEDVRIVDVFPTVLSLFGVPVPVDCDGVSLVGEAGARVGKAQRPEAQTDSLSDDEEALIEARLKDLGYV